VKDKKTFCLSEKIQDPLQREEFPLLEFSKEFCGTSPSENFFILIETKKLAGKTCPEVIKNSNRCQKMRPNY